MAIGIIIEEEIGSYEEYLDMATQTLIIDGIADLRAMISNGNTITICWLFRIVEYLVRYHLGRILECDTAVYSSGTCDVHLILDSTRDPIILPPVTPAEHFRVIVHPVSGGQSYEAYLLECREAFHSNRVMGITGVTTDSQPDGIYYCMHIANELKRTDEAKEIVTSGWIHGRGLYAVDMVMVHQDTTITEVLPGTGRMSKWNYWSRCKLKRKPLVLKH